MVEVLLESDPHAELDVARLHHRARIDIAQTAERGLVRRRREVAEAEQRVVGRRSALRFEPGP